jgi:hypothetical protein
MAKGCMLDGPDICPLDSWSLWEFISYFSLWASRPLPQKLNKNKKFESERLGQKYKEENLLVVRLWSGVPALGSICKTEILSHHTVQIFQLYRRARMRYRLKL